MGAEALIELSGVRIVASSGDARAVVRELGSPEWGALARVVKVGARGMVAAGVVNAGGVRAVIVKAHGLSGVRDRLASVLGVSRMARQVRGAAVLARAGVATASVLVLARGRSARFGVTEVVVLEFVPGVSVAHHAARGDLSDGERRGLARALGAQVARIADAGLVNRDHKASNIVVRTGGDAGMEPVVVDTVGIRRSDPRAARVRMLFGLVVELVGIGAVPSRTDRMRVVRGAIGEGAERRSDRRRVWRAVDALVRVHGDATPKDDPLVDAAGR